MAFTLKNLLPEDDDEQYVKHTWYITIAWVVVVLLIAMIAALGIFLFL